MAIDILFPLGYKPVIKHGEHDQSSHGNWATGAQEEMSKWDPEQEVPKSPRNAGSVPTRAWDNWEHGPDGTQFVDLYRQYAGEMLGLDVPKSPLDTGGYLNYLTGRGFGGSSTEVVREQTKAMLEAIEKGGPQPSLYRGLTPANNPETEALIQEFRDLKPGDRIDMPLTSTSRSLGVATWYAANRGGTTDDKPPVLIKIQEGAKGISRSPGASFYPADYEVITSGKFEVVGSGTIKMPYWERETISMSTGSNPERGDYVTGWGSRKVDDYRDSSGEIKREAYDALYNGIKTGDWGKYRSDTTRFTTDRGGQALSPNFKYGDSFSISRWDKVPDKEFTVIEVKMVEPHKVQKEKDLGLKFHNLLAGRVTDEPGEEPIEKHGDHDQSSHGNWAHGIEVAPEVVRSVLDRVKENGGLSVNLKDGSEPTKGFMVAKGRKYSAIVKADDFYNPDKGAEILSSYMKQHKADLATGKNYLGLWHNTEDGQVYLDVSENIQDEAEATSRGRERDQISIWDVANFKEIPTGGTGAIEKTRGGRTARFITDDRRTNRRIRETDLGEVVTKQRTTKVIYFEYGLKPVFKHGEHDQSEHGNWARGYTDEERSRIEEMKDRGPSLEDLDKVIVGKREIDDDEIKLLVENDSDLYSQATEDIDFRVEEALARLQGEFPNHEYTEQEKMTIYENVQRDMIDSYIEDNREDLADRARMESGDEGEISAEELTSFFDEVYSVSHTGKNSDGNEVTISSSVQEVYRDGDDIMVSGIVLDEDGNEIGQMSRRFFKEGDNWNVEHALFALDDEYRGTGFGKEFIRQSEAWYTAKGMGYIEVGTAWDGARHWARSGYDFRPDKIAENLDNLRMNVEEIEGFERGTPARAEYDALMARATNGYQPDFEDESGNKYSAWDSVKDMKSDNFPLPAEFANIGYTPGATEWAGKNLMYGLKMKYVKVLTAEGQKLLDGPIDHDGDGMVYDGTAREKPAPGGGNK